MKKKASFTVCTHTHTNKNALRNAILTEASTYMTVKHS